MRDHHDLRVISRDTGIMSSDVSASNVRRVLAEALKDLDTYDAAEDTEQRVAAIAHAYDALREVHRMLPPVTGWVCGYHWGFDRGDEHWSSFSAHATREEAEAWLPYWRQEVASRDRWTVEQRPCSITTWVMGGPPEVKDEDGAA